jgi:hypothetical protein
MKVPFKSTSLAVAVAAASIGYAGIVNAQSLADNEGLGDLAIVPYYTVQGSWSTGVSVINTSDATQVIKIRLRRAVDSMDALDFNVVMSPKDVWTGYVQKAPEGDEIRFYSNDNSCTVPAFSVTDPEINYFVMPDIYRLGAEEGYIEVIAMGATINEDQPIAQDAEHDSSGVPADCVRVRDNFFRGTGSDASIAYYADSATALGAGRTRGVINSALTHQYTSSADQTPVPSEYTDSDNVLKVSWFIKSDESGTEFGADAVHIADFMDGASITNQQVGVNEGDLQGFDHPDLNGGAPFSALSLFPNAADTGRYEGLRSALGALEVINDWSANTGDGLFTVNTDWVITTPGQYVMTNLPQYIDALEDDNDPEECTRVGAPNGCDNRDIPMTVSASVYDREEGEIQVDEDDLVISPQPPGEPTIVQFDQEVNIIRWTESVLDAQKAVIIPTPEGANAGWASVSVTSSPGTGICEYTSLTGETPSPMTCSATFTPAPLVGFVAWERNFEAQPDANFGRSVDHSYVTSN